MDALIKILKVLLELIKEPLIYYLGTLKGKQDGRRDLEAETKDKTLEIVAKAKRLSEHPISDDDVKRLCDKYSSGE